MGPSTKDIFAALSRNIPTKNLTLCKDSNLPNDLLAMEERQVIRSYKFGVGYLKKGQSTEEHMLSNKYGMRVFRNLNVDEQRTLPPNSSSFWPFWGKQ